MHLTKFTGDIIRIEFQLQMRTLRIIWMKQWQEMLQLTKFGKW